MTPLRPVRHLGVVDIIGNPGGSVRFTRALLPALRRLRPELRITLYGRSASLRRDDVTPELVAAGVRVVELAWTADRPWKSRPLRTRLGYKVARRLRRAEATTDSFVAASLKREVDRIDAVDVMYFPWPYQTPVPRVSAPLVATIHDLNFRYFFGAPVYGPDQSAELDRQIDEWRGSASIVTSSQFMADEFRRLFPGAPAVPVIRPAPFSLQGTGHPGRTVPPGAGPGQTDGLAAPYLLCPTQLTVHKNLGPLIAAQAILRQQFPTLRLVITGAGSEMATGRSTPIGTIRTAAQPDVLGLGYVSNERIEELIEGAAVVVNPSLYEAGNGPGLDAWSRGVPVAMSAIPPFTEHLTFLGVEAAVFDPRNPDDIAAKLADVLDRPDAWSAAAARSSAAIARRTWDQAAAEYLEVFDAAYEAQALG
jgi:glycosyltransferase involved in cell wall biosynthesis